MGMRCAGAFWELFSILRTVSDWQTGPMWDHSNLGFIFMSNYPELGVVARSRLGLSRADGVEEL